MQYYAFLCVKSVLWAAKYNYITAKDHAYVVQGVKCVNIPF